MLPYSNSNNISANLRVVALNLQLYGLDKNLCIGIDDPTIVYELLMKSILSSVVKLYSISVGTYVYIYLNDLLNLLRARRRPSETTT